MTNRPRNLRNPARVSVLRGAVEEMPEYLYGSSQVIGVYMSGINQLEPTA